MTTEARPIAARPGPPRTLTLSRITWLASIVFFGALPALVLALLAIDVHGETIAIDLHQFYNAAQAILDGRSPYPANGEPTTSLGGPYPYPPLPALLPTPLSLPPLEVAGAVLMACSSAPLSPSRSSSTCATGAATGSPCCGPP